MMNPYPDKKFVRRKHGCCNEMHCVNTQSQMLPSAMLHGCDGADEALMANPGFLPYATPPNDLSSSNDEPHSHWSQQDSSRDPEVGGDGNKRERNRMRRREERANPFFRDKERAKARLRMQEKRKDPTYRELERLKNRIRMRTVRSGKGDDKSVVGAAPAAAATSAVVKRKRPRNKGASGGGSGAANSSHAEHVTSSSATKNDTPTNMLPLCYGNSVVDLVNEYVHHLFK